MLAHGMPECPEALVRRIKRKLKSPPFWRAFVWGIGTGYLIILASRQKRRFDAASRCFKMRRLISP